MTRQRDTRCPCWRITPVDARRGQGDGAREMPIVAIVGFGVARWKVDHLRLRTGPVKQAAEGATKSVRPDASAGEGGAGSERCGPARQRWGEAEGRSMGAMTIWRSGRGSASRRR